MEDHVALTGTSETLRRIEMYFEDFRSAIEKCRSAKAFIAADWQDAYTRLARLRERFMIERTELDRLQYQALAKVFEDDSFTKGMLEIRQVGEHIKRRHQFTIRTVRNEPIALDPESSAMAVFSASIVTLSDIDGNPWHIDHIEMLQEMEKRVASALKRARGVATTQ